MQHTRIWSTTTLSTRRIHDMWRTGHTVLPRIARMLPCCIQYRQFPRRLSSHLSALCGKVTVTTRENDNITITFHLRSEGHAMVLFHRGAAIQASTIRYGNTFVARACILKEDGESTSLGDLGQFASQTCAYEFAVRCASAFVDGLPIPRSPFG